MKTTAAIEQDLERIATQEQALIFSYFDHASAWTLGARIPEICLAKKIAVTIEIRLLREEVFFYAMPGTTPANADWARRKRNTVELMHRSSYAVGLSLLMNGDTLEENMGLPLRDYASHGGSFPIQVAGVGCVGVVTISGLPQRNDHSVVVMALAQMCGVAVLELGPEY
jgi:uncharacterized protein (UPF0303 family)